MIINNVLNFIGYNHYAKINKQIFLGDIYSSKNINFINENGINVIINCSKNLDFEKNFNGFKYRVAVNDDFSYSSIVSMIFYFRELIPIINNHLDKGDIILIHCRAGMQRSASFLSALLMYRYKISKYQSMKIVRNKRYITFLPGPNFGLSLDIYQKYLNSNLNYGI